MPVREASLRHVQRMVARQSAAMKSGQRISRSNLQYRRCPRIRRYKQKKGGGQSQLPNESGTTERDPIGRIARTTHVGAARNASAWPHSQDPQNGRPEEDISRCFAV